MCMGLSSNTQVRGPTSPQSVSPPTVSTFRVLLSRSEKTVLGFQPPALISPSEGHTFSVFSPVEVLLPSPQESYLQS